MWHVTVHDIYYDMLCDMTWQLMWHDMRHDMYYDKLCDMWQDMTYIMTCDMTCYVTCDRTWHANWCDMTCHVTWHVLWHVTWHVLWHVTRPFNLITVKTRFSLLKLYAILSNLISKPILHQLYKADLSKSVIGGKRTRRWPTVTRDVSMMSWRGLLTINLMICAL